MHFCIYSFLNLSEIMLWCSVELQYPKFPNDTLQILRYPQKNREKQKGREELNNIW